MKWLRYRRFIAEFWFRAWLLRTSHRVMVNQQDWMRDILPPPPLPLFETRPIPHKDKR